MTIEMKKTRVKVTKSFYSGISILDISKTLMYKFCYNYSTQSMETEQKFVILILATLLYYLH